MNGTGGTGMVNMWWSGWTATIWGWASHVRFRLLFELKQARDLNRLRNAVLKLLGLEPSLLRRQDLLLGTWRTWRQLRQLCGSTRKDTACSSPGIRLAAAAPTPLCVAARKRSDTSRHRVAIRNQSAGSPKFWGQVLKS